MTNTTFTQKTPTPTLHALGARAPLPRARFTDGKKISHRTHMKFLLVLAQIHEEFRVPELQALAEMENIKCDFTNHNLNSPFMVVELESEEQAAKLIKRSILSKAIYRLFGEGETIEEMHASAQKDPSIYKEYKGKSFRFDFESFHGKRSRDSKMKVIKELLVYMGLDGPTRLKDSELVFTVWEMFEVYNPTPLYSWLTKFVANSDRKAIDIYNLKKRKFIGTTSFDAELSMVTCNMAKVRANDFVYDPFSGTGSFPVAAARHRAMVYGSDIDFRALKGYPLNFEQYGTSTYFGDTFCMDFTHNAFRKDIMFDAIVSDPPYGIREGLKVCGVKDEDRARFEEKASLRIEGEYAHRRRDYVQHKIQYSFELLLQDILNFAGERLVPGGRLAFWLPLPEVDGLQQFPQHKHLRHIDACPQHFNKWTRWLLTYERRQPGEEGENKVISLADFREHYYNRSEPKHRREGTAEQAELVVKV